MQPKLPDTATMLLWLTNRENQSSRRFPTPTPFRKRVRASASKCMSSSRSSQSPSWED